MAIVTMLPMIILRRDGDDLVIFIVSKENGKKKVKIKR